MRGAADVLAARGSNEKSFVSQPAQHPSHRRIREAEQTPCFVQAHAQRWHLVEFGAPLTCVSEESCALMRALSASSPFGAGATPFVAATVPFGAGAAA